jgi:hypothetical protein
MGGRVVQGQGTLHGLVVEVTQQAQGLLGADGFGLKRCGHV